MGYKLVAILDVRDPCFNDMALKVFADRESGLVFYELSHGEGHTLWHIAALDCENPSLPDNTYEYDTNKKLLEAVIEAVNGGLFKVMNERLFWEVKA